MLLVVRTVAVVYATIFMGMTTAAALQAKEAFEVEPGLRRILWKSTMERMRRLVKLGRTVAALGRGSSLRGRRRGRTGGRDL
jgi:hypothetical protein